MTRTKPKPEQIKQESTYTSLSKMISTLNDLMPKENQSNGKQTYKQMSRITYFFSLQTHSTSCMLHGNNKLQNVNFIF